MESKDEGPGVKADTPHPDAESTRDDKSTKPPAIGSRHARSDNLEPEINISAEDDSQDDGLDEDEVEIEDKVFHVTPEPAKPAKPAKESKTGVILGAAALVVALGALGAAVWPYFATEEVDVVAVYSDEEVAAAKADTCRAFTLASAAIEVRSSMNPGENPDQAYIEVLAANARSAFTAAGSYLLNHVSDATPEDLATAVVKFADHSSEVGMAAWAGLGTTDPLMAEPLANAGDVSAKITEMCRDAAPASEGEQTPAEQTPAGETPAEQAPPSEGEPTPAPETTPTP